MAIALKSLEGEKHTFGVYLPTLIGIRRQMHTFHEEGSLQHCTPLVDAIQEGFEKRFGDSMDIYNPKSFPLYIAMITNPQFKLNYIGMQRIPSHTSNKVRTMLFKSGQEIISREKQKKNEEECVLESEPEPVAAKACGQ